ncbi:MAG: alpha/beta fold hydrolase [Gammaproteobacteria bacterium]|nr:alpha/beta fold hydrolase [Gammaproteobacteria bacterium]
MADESMKERDITFANGNINLSGTLLLPDSLQPSPVVLFLHGSGPLDRNSNLKSFKLNIFNTLAESFAQSGFASLRYDKRGCGQSGGHYMQAGHFDLLDDASAAIMYLRKNPKIDNKRIYLVGHSEGTLLAAQLCIKYSDIAGIILLTPFIQKLKNILRNQAYKLKQSIQGNNSLKGKFLQALTRKLFDPERIQEKLIHKIETSQQDTLRFYLSKIPAKWFREGFQADPDYIYHQVNCPVLIIAGGKDLQCDPQDAQQIKKRVRNECKVYILPELTHILRYDNQQASFFHYRRLAKQAMAADIALLCNNWLIQQSITENKAKPSKTDQLELA